MKRKVTGQPEEWQVHSLGGELLAAYAANDAAASPLKEYGYRNGQLLVTTEPATAQPPSGVNVALAANGASAGASSVLGAQTPANAIMIDVFGLQQNYSSPAEPTPTLTSSYALTNFEVQYWTARCRQGS